MVPSLPIFEDTQNFCFADVRNSLHVFLDQKTSNYWRKRELHEQNWRWQFADIAREYRVIISNKYVHQPLLYYFCTAQIIVIMLFKESRSLKRGHQQLSIRCCSKQVIDIIGLVALLAPRSISYFSNILWDEWTPYLPELSVTYVHAFRYVSHSTPWEISMRNIQFIGGEYGPKDEDLPVILRDCWNHCYR